MLMPNNYEYIEKVKLFFPKIMFQSSPLSINNSNIAIYNYIKAFRSP